MTDLAQPVTDTTQPHLLHAGDTHTIELVKALIKEAGGVKIDRRQPGPKLAEALAKAQGEFTNIGKDRAVDVVPKDGSKGYTFRYATLPAIMRVVRPPLSKHGLSLLMYPTIHHREGVQNQYIEVTAYLTHSSGECVVASIEIPFADRAPQRIGIIISYCRRYLINTLLGIAQEDESDYDDQGIVDGPPPMPNVTPASAQPRKPELPKTEKSAPAPTPPPPAGADTKPAATEDEFHLRLDEAKTKADLKKVGAEINDVKAGLPTDAHARLTEHYRRRNVELEPKKE